MSTLLVARIPDTTEHRTAVSEVQMLKSMCVEADRIRAEDCNDPNPTPITVTLNDPVPGLFPEISSLMLTLSTENAKLTLDATSMAVSNTRRLAIVPRPARAVMVVSECQSDD
jgi:hypothetical protein